MNSVSILRHLLKEMRPLDLVSHTIEHTFDNPIGFQSRGFRVGVLPTLVIDGRTPLTATWKGFRDDTRRHIRRAREHLSLIECADPEEFAAFYLRNVKSNDPFYDFSCFASLYEACVSRRQGRLIAVVDSQRCWHAAGFFVWDHFAVHPLVGTRDRDFADPGAMNLLFWWGIEQAHKLGIYFVEGISSQSRWRFMAGFGGTLVNRLVVRRSNPPVSLLLGIRRTQRRIDWSDTSLFIT